MIRCVPGVLAAVAGAVLAQPAVPPAAPPPPQVATHPYGSPDAAVLAAWHAENLPRRDYADVVGGATIANDPPWQARERETFRELVVRAKPDILVAPVQVQGYGIDRAMRAMLTEGIVRALDGRAAPATLVDRALGEGRRRLGPGDTWKLARDAGVRDVAQVYVGHDGGGKLLVTAVIDRGPGADGQRRRVMRSWDGEVLPAGVPPVQALQPLVPRIAEYILEPRPAPRPAPPGTLGDLPPSPAQLATWAVSPTRRAAALVLLAALTPPEDARGRQRLLVQALGDLAHADPRNADAAFLRAYALLRTDIRPLAVAAARQVDSPANRALVEIANGNVAEAAEAIAKVKPTLPRLVLELELGELRAVYGMTFDGGLLAQTSTFVAKHPAWGDLFKARVLDYDLWQVGAMPSTKQMLDLLFPTTGIDATSVERGIVALGRVPAPSDFVAASIEHVHRARRGDAGIAACLKDLATPCVRAALLDLLESRAVAEGLGQFRHVSEMQNLYPEAKRLHAALDPSFSGHPEWEIATATMRQAAARNATPVEQRNAREEVLRGARLVVQLEQGQSRLSRAALAFMATPSEDSRLALIGYGPDKPPRPYWMPLGWTYERPTVVAERTEALAYAETEVSAINALVQAASGTPDAATVDALVARALAERMHGNPGRAALLRDRAPTEGGGREAQLAAALRANPADFASYIALADFQIRERGDYAAAEKTYASFPQFRPGAPVDNPVAKSNNAAHPGHIFFWAGEAARALRFYGIASATRTGSSAEMLSSGRVALLDGRYDDYAEITLDRIRRYDDPYATRDHLIFLFVTGSDAEAWAGVDRAMPMLRSPLPWQAADVGHRAAARDWPGIQGWILAEPRLSAGPAYLQLPLVHAIAAGTVDRRPPADLGAFLRKIERRPRSTTETSPGRVAVPAAEHGTQNVLRSAFRESERGAWKGDVEVANWMAYLADGLVAVRSGRDAEALEVFDAMGALYPIDGRMNHMSGVHTPMSIALPYYALAAGRTGDRIGLERHLDALPEGGRKFDQWLALGILKAMRKDREAAIATLRRALRERPLVGGEWRPVPSEYQWAEACEALHAATRDAAYRDLALDWARRFATIVPTAAWAHAMVATHTTDERERLRSLGRALALDPRSERALALPAELRERVRREGLVVGPFDRSRTDKSAGKPARKS